MRKIILASASPRRRELLEIAGIPFTVYPSKAEEFITTTIPDEAVEELSRQKCLDVFERMDDDGLVIGADTVVAIHGQILGKPKDDEDARKMLTLLQGNIHDVYTGVTLMERIGDKTRSKTFSVKTEVEFYPVTQEEITRYITTREPLDKAGAYGIQGRALVFIKEIKGDYYNVVGLPISRLYQELKDWDIELEEI